MKKVLIVNNNLDMGGIQKSLINLLSDERLYENYQFTLLLLSKSGELLDDVPEWVNIITPRRIYRILGLSKEKLKEQPIYFVAKVFLTLLCTIIGKRRTMRFMGIFQKKYTGYDAVISYSHLTRDTVLSNGCGEFVLDKTDCRKRVCLIHCDYKNSGTCTSNNNRVYGEFDRIGCCSDSVRKVFVAASEIDNNKVVTLRNFYNDSIIELSMDNEQKYENDYINMIVVARLSHEKGIDVAVDALRRSERSDIRLYIVGDGPLKETLVAQVKEMNLQNQVFFLGEQKNPYRYMKNADYLLVPSRHEAAPMVFDEAKVLNLSIISSETTSAFEMLDDNDYITSDFETVFRSIKHHKAGVSLCVDNKLQEMQFSQLLI